MSYHRWPLVACLAAGAASRIYTTGDAMLVIERLVALKWYVTIDVDGSGVDCILTGQSRSVAAKCDTLPHAVALAALKAMEFAHA